MPTNNKKSPNKYKDNKANLSLLTEYEYELRGDTSSLGDKYYDKLSSIEEKIYPFHSSSNYIKYREAVEPLLKAYLAEKYGRIDYMSPEVNLNQAGASVDELTTDLEKKYSKRLGEAALELGMDDFEKFATRTYHDYLTEKYGVSNPSKYLKSPKKYPFSPSSKERYVDLGKNNNNVTEYFDTQTQKVVINKNGQVAELNKKPLLKTESIDGKSRSVIQGNQGNVIDLESGIVYKPSRGNSPWKEVAPVENLSSIGSAAAPVATPRTATTPVATPKTATTPVATPKTATAPVTTPRTATTPVATPKTATAPVATPKTATAPVTTPKNSNLRRYINIYYTRGNS